ncbi:succinate--CoA ligase [GDP-forming] subunit beta, mitochondrial [Condylostylus longicornis]|uniref:succinate--CoA ligase [GDP-forming] subunit beta, mitochondrial n=1 Tax=Condylostylus longicornis TaxID=2530218 RepID=UPI00244E0B9A|nr:succinate--CoA ligase [GDP-forming] subunit beta, mitochondrial [Condylostylus longicornis]
MIGKRLITKQTPKEGILVRKVMVARSVNIIRETYLCILMDRESNGPVVIASPAGGVDIEAVAEETPEKILKLPVDIKEGLTQEQGLKIAKFLEFKTDEMINKASSEILKLWNLFKSVDAVQIEINPLAETDSKEVISVDAKLNFDDNAEFRQKKIFEMENTDESDPREVEASKNNLNYVAMDGNIGCLVNGAGLAMATMDIIKLNGGSPANFLDVGGGVKEDQVLKAFQILTNDKNVKAILVNVFGGIVNCETIARGVINASKKLDLKLPLIVRLAGTNAVQANELLRNSKLKIETAIDLDDAARKAVRSLQ